MSFDSCIPKGKISIYEHQYSGYLGYYTEFQSRTQTRRFGGCGCLNKLKIDVYKCKL